MGSAAEDLLRLALQVDREGRPATRDALLTLAVAESLTEEPALAKRCRDLLRSRQPDHWFAGAQTHAQALGEPRVMHALERLRAIFPPVRVQRLLLRAEALRGPYCGRRMPLGRVLKGLTLPVPGVRVRSRQVSHPRSLPFPIPVPQASGSEPGVDADARFVAMYWSVLVAMAVLLSSVLDTSSRESRAA